MFTRVSEPPASDADDDDDDDVGLLPDVLPRAGDLPRAGERRAGDLPRAGERRAGVMA